MERETIIMERILHIYSEGFLEKVFPFRELLPNDLFNDVMVFYLVSGWIDMKDKLHYNVKNMPYWGVRYQLNRKYNALYIM